VRLSWVDFTTNDNRKMLDVLKLFRQPGTLDDLGIGGVRDAFGDLFFPGITTIETRARYFLLVPWLYLWRERQEKVGAVSANVAEKYRRSEIALIEKLIAGHVAADLPLQGIIGHEARHILKRLPSEIYWGGLGRWKVRAVEITQSEYFRQLPSFLSLQRRADHANSEGEFVEHSPRIFDPGLPAPPDGFPHQPLTLVLTADEADYIRHRILTSVPGTLLSILVDRTRPVEGAIQFVWDHPEAALFPERLRSLLHHARLFSEGMYGASILYNLMLAEALPNQEWVNDYRKRLDAWSRRTRRMRRELREWNRDEMWSALTTGRPLLALGTRAFCEDWLRHLSFVADSSDAADSAAARARILNRELTVKGPRAKLHDRRYLQMWGGSSGMDQLDYRWSTARIIVNDVGHALGRKPIRVEAT
jgi:hypothetical protein